MGTKSDPGSFDCYADAEPDEPMFVLLGRDKECDISLGLLGAAIDLGKS